MLVITTSEVVEELLDECIALENSLKAVDVSVYKVEKRLFGWLPISKPTYEFALYNDDKFLCELTGFSSVMQVSMLLAILTAIAKIR